MRVRNIALFGIIGTVFGVVFGFGIPSGFGIFRPELKSSHLELQTIQFYSATSTLGDPVPDLSELSDLSNLANLANLTKLPESSIAPNALGENKPIGPIGDRIGKPRVPKSKRTPYSLPVLQSKSVSNGQTVGHVPSTFIQPAKKPDIHQPLSFPRLGLHSSPPQPNAPLFSPSPGLAGGDGAPYRPINGRHRIGHQGITSETQDSPGMPNRGSLPTFHFPELAGPAPFGPETEQPDDVKGVLAAAIAPSVDSDGDGITDIHDMAPSWGPVDLDWNTEYPRGAVSFEESVQGVGYEGKSRIYKTTWEWFLGFKKTGRHLIYEGKKGTRSVNVHAEAVLAELRKRTKGSEYIPGQVSFQKSEPGKSTSYTYGGDYFVRKEYHLDYTRKKKTYRAEFYNDRSVELFDKTGKPYLFGKFGFGVSPSVDHELIIQVSVPPKLDRTGSSPKGNVYRALAFRYVFLPDETPTQGAVPRFEGRAMAVPLNDHAYQFSLRISAKAIRYVTGGAKGHMLLTPVWITGASTLFSNIHSVEAADSNDLKVGALSLRQTTGTSIRTVTVKSPEDFLAIDGAAELPDGNTVDRWLIRVVQEKQDKLSYLVDQMRVTNKVLNGARQTIAHKTIKTVMTSKFNSVKEIKLPDTARYNQVLKGVTVAHAGAIAVLEGSNAVIAYQEGDILTGTIFAARGATGALFWTATGKLALPIRGTHMMLGSGYDAVVSFANGEVVEGSLHLGRTGMGVVWALGGEKPLSLGFGKVVQLGTVMRVGMGAVMVGLNLYKASQTNDSIDRQAYYEQAAAMAVDTGILVIPVFGSPVWMVWSITTLVLQHLDSDNLTFKIFATPGSLVAHFGTAWFTDEIPTVYAQDAIRRELKSIQSDIAEELDQGRPTILISALPPV